MFSAAAAAPRVSLGRLMRGPVVAGVLILVVFIGSFGIWAASAPLSSGAIAAGVVSPDSNRKVIQHLEGGIIAAVHVREGDHVAVGQRLVTLQSVGAMASMTSDQQQWLRLLVVRARLTAHAAEAEELELPQELTQTDIDNNLATFIANEQSLFETQRRSQIQLQEIAARQIEQLQSEIASLEAEVVGLMTQKQLIDQELPDAEQLLGQQLIQRARVNTLLREQAELQSGIAGTRADIARANQRIEEVKLSLVQAEETFRIKIAEETTQINNQIAVLDQRLTSAADILRRTQVLSPVEGTVLNLRHTTEGGVIGSGEPIMDIVPSLDELIVVARLSPQDIDIVHVGLVAHVVLRPFASRNLLPLNGEVVQVGADSIVDEKTQEAYYSMRIRVPMDELSKYEGLYMSPGMPADVTVVTGERTMAQYLAEPLLRAVRNAFVYD